MQQPRYAPLALSAFSLAILTALAAFAADAPGFPENEVNSPRVIQFGLRYQF